MIGNDIIFKESWEFSIFMNIIIYSDDKKFELNFMYD